MSEFEMMKVNEISLDEMGNIAGGRVKKPAAKAGCTLYRIKPGDPLIRIAKAFHTTMNAILRVNPQIKHRNLIIANTYLYIPMNFA